jgi:hypothetical protein
MRPALLQLLGVVTTTTLLGVVPATRGQDYLEEDYSAEVADDAVAQAPPGLEDLARAQTPSAAVEAYAKARLANSDNLVVDQVYMRRMVQLGAPEMCATQAERITRSTPDDYLAWAVLAFNSAARNDFASALVQLARAARYESRDQFVQRTGGQLMAWFDTAADQSQLPSDALDAARDIRRMLGGRSDFAEAYRDARDYYQQQGQGQQGEVSPAPEPAPTTTPQPAPIEPAPAPVTTYEPGYVTYGYDYGYSYPVYTGVYGGGYFGYPWYAGSYWWPWCGSSTIIVSRDRCWPRYYDHDRRWYSSRRYDGGGVHRYSGGHRSAPDIVRRGTAPAPRHGAGDAPHRGGRSGVTPRDTRGRVRPPASSGSGRHPLRADTPGVKRWTAPGLKPSTTPGLKPPSRPGLKAPAPSRHSSVVPRTSVGRAPRRFSPRAATPAPRAAPRGGARSLGGRHGR